MEATIKNKNKRLCGFGKIILFGEHFVVHGLPAVVTSIDLTTTAYLEYIGNNQLILMDNRPKTPLYQPCKTVEYENMVRAIFVAMGVEPFGWYVTLGGTLPVTNGGIGASAAAAVAVVRAIDHYFSFNLTEHLINQAAFVGEQEIHGTPSGIDNMAAVFGGTFVFTKNTRSPDKIVIKNSLYLVIVDSGNPTNTRHVITAVKKIREKNASHMEKVFNRYRSILDDALIALTQQNTSILGHAMTQNHWLLSEIGLSSQTLDSLVVYALSAGALGAKVTGTGCGGVMVILASHEHNQMVIAQTLAKAGFFTIQQTIFSACSNQINHSFLFQ